MTLAPPSRTRVTTALPIPAVPQVTRIRFPLNSFAINGNWVTLNLCHSSVDEQFYILYAKNKQMNSHIWRKTKLRLNFVLYMAKLSRLTCSTDRIPKWEQYSAANLIGIY